MPNELSKDQKNILIEIIKEEIKKNNSVVYGTGKEEQEPFNEGVVGSEAKATHGFKYFGVHANKEGKKIGTFIVSASDSKIGFDRRIFVQYELDKGNKPINVKAFHNELNKDEREKRLEEEKTGGSYKQCNKLVTYSVDLLTNTIDKKEEIIDQNVMLKSKKDKRIGDVTSTITATNLSTKDKENSFMIKTKDNNKYSYLSIKRNLGKDLDKITNSYQTWKVFQQRIQEKNPNNKYAIRMVDIINDFLTEYKTEYLDKGKCHQDIKALNVLVDDTGKSHIIDEGSDTVCTYFTSMFGKSIHELDEDKKNIHRMMRDFVGISALIIECSACIFNIDVIGFKDQFESINRVDITKLLSNSNEVLMPLSGKNEYDMYFSILILKLLTGVVTKDNIGENDMYKKLASNDMQYRRLNKIAEIISNGGVYNASTSEVSVDNGFKKIKDDPKYKEFCALLNTAKDFLSNVILYYNQVTENVMNYSYVNKNAKIDFDRIVKMFNDEIKSLLQDQLQQIPVVEKTKDEGKVIPKETVKIEDTNTYKKLQQIETKISSLQQIDKTVIQDIQEQLSQLGKEEEKGVSQQQQEQLEQLIVKLQNKISTTYENIITEVVPKALENTVTQSIVQRYEEEKMDITKKNEYEYPRFEFPELSGSNTVEEMEKYDEFVRNFNKFINNLYDKRNALRDNDKNSQLVKELDAICDKFGRNLFSEVYKIEHFNPKFCMNTIKETQEIFNRSIQEATKIREQYNKQINPIVHSQISNNEGDQTDLKHHDKLDKLLTEITRQSGGSPVNIQKTKTEQKQEEGIKVNNAPK